MIPQKANIGNEEKKQKDLINFLENKEIKFRKKDEERIIDRMSFFINKYSLESFSELLHLLKENEHVLDNAIDYLERGKVYNEQNQTFYPLVTKRKTLKDYAELSKKRKASKRKRLIVNLPKVESPFDPPKDEKNLTKLFEFFEKQNFPYKMYKPKYLLRRIHRRMRRSDSETYREYISKLELNQGEFDLLKQSMSINVTRFFRNNAMFDEMKEKILPQLCEKEGTIKIWSAGCAVGAEPYSIAILVDSLYKTKDQCRVKILATDISVELIQKAIEGKYSKNLLKNVDKHYLSKYFKRENNETYLLNNTLKHYVSFIVHDLKNPAPIKDVDLILCRNVLIYLSNSQCEKLFKRFHDVLNPKGYLVLGKCERMKGERRDLFEIIDRKNKIYQKI